MTFACTLGHFDKISSSQVETTKKNVVLISISMLVTVTMTSQKKMIEAFGHDGILCCSFC